MYSYNLCQHTYTYPNTVDKFPYSSAAMIKFWISFVYIFVHNRSLLSILLNSSLSCTNITTRVFWTFSSENLAPPLIFLVQILRLELDNDNQYSNSHEKEQKLWPLYSRIFYTYCYYNFILCGTFNSITSFTPIFNKEL